MHVIFYSAAFILLIAAAGDVYAEESCCSDHGGIDSCNLKMENLQCADRFNEPKCVCDASTHIDRKQGTTSDWKRIAKKEGLSLTHAAKAPRSSDDKKPVGKSSISKKLVKNIKKK